jgi:hypothetical protein
MDPRFPVSIPKEMAVILRTILCADTGNIAFSGLDHTEIIVAPMGSYGQGVGHFDGPRTVAVDITVTCICERYGNKRLRYLEMRFQVLELKYESNGTRDS